jgi:hypothetical protein
MTQTAIILLIISLSGCAASYDAARKCQEQAGGYPNEWTEAFGIFGVAANLQTDEMQKYDDSVDACMDRYRANLKSKGE